MRLAAGACKGDVGNHGCFVRRVTVGGKGWNVTAGVLAAGWLGCGGSSSSSSSSSSSTGAAVTAVAAIAVVAAVTTLAVAMAIAVADAVAVSGVE